jgi:N-acyl-D-amino-acid deacylase
VTDWILSVQRDDGYWKCRSHRPPSEASDFTTTYVAIRALEQFAFDQPREVVDEAIERASLWLAEAVPVDTEDRVFRLLCFDLVGTTAAPVETAIAELKAAQRDDGGWSQTPEMQSDAYATAITLYGLSRLGVPPRSDTWQRGLRYLLDHQQDDGSWHVVSRSKPFQKYFESGFPHGKDQFISTTATGWATIVLIESLPENE